MTIPCPECGGIMRSRTVRKTSAGITRRRFDCTSCKHRQHINGDDYDLGPPRRFDSVTVAAIRSSSTTHAEEARIRRCSRENIRQIRAGILYRDLWDPGLTPGSVSCHGCVHWSDGGCTLGFADPITRGPGFARECAAYWEKKE